MKRIYTSNTALNIVAIFCLVSICQSCKFIYHCPTYEAHYDYHLQSVAKRKNAVIKSSDLRKRNTKAKKSTGSAEFASN
jgi:hypothetical protein